MGLPLASSSNPLRTEHRRPPCPVHLPVCLPSLTCVSCPADQKRSCSKSPDVSSQGGYATNFGAGLSGGGRGVEGHIISAVFKALVTRLVKSAKELKSTENIVSSAALLLAGPGAVPDRVPSCCRRCSATCAGSWPTSRRPTAASSGAWHSAASWTAPAAPTGGSPPRRPPASSSQSPPPLVRAPVCTAQS